MSRLIYKEPVNQSIFRLVCPCSLFVRKKVLSTGYGDTEMCEVVISHSESALFVCLI